MIVKELRVNKGIIKIEITNEQYETMNEEELLELLEENNTTLEEFKKLNNII